MFVLISISLFICKELTVFPSSLYSIFSFFEHCFFFVLSFSVFEFEVEYLSNESLDMVFLLISSSLTTSIGSSFCASFNDSFTFICISMSSFRFFSKFLNTLFPLENGHIWNESTFFSSSFFLLMKSGNEKWLLGQFLVTFVLLINLLMKISSFLGLVNFWLAS